MSVPERRTTRPRSTTGVRDKANYSRKKALEYPPER